MDIDPLSDIAEHPELVIEWLRGLHLSDTIAAAKRLSPLLDRLAGESLSGRQRFAILEAMGPPLSVILANLAKNHFSDSHFSLSITTGRVLRLADHLCRSMIEGYESILKTEQESSWLFRQTHAALGRIAAHRIFFYSYQIAANHQRVNAEGATGLWLRLHELYLIAVSQRWERQIIEFQGATRYGRYSIEQYYKRILLISLVPLGRLRRDQVREIERSLAVWCHDLELIQHENRSHAQRVQFYVAIERDLGPQQVASDLQLPESGCLLLDTRRLDSHFFELLTQAKDTPNDKIRLTRSLEISPAILKLLKSYWMMSVGGLSEFSWHPNEVEAWIGGMPLLNVRESSRMAYRILGEANLRDIPVGHRFAFLEQMGYPVSVILANLSRHYGDNAFPLAERSLKVANLANDICEMMIGGYQMVLEADNGGGWHLPRLRRRGMISTHRIFYYSTLMLENHKMMNSPCRSGVWRRLNGLYRLALVSGWSGTPLGHDRVKGYGNRTINHFYKRTLLLSLIPYQSLRADQLREVRKSIDRLVDGVEISLLHPGESWEESDFLIDIGKDLGPIGWGGAEHLDGCDNCLRMDVGDVQDELLQLVLRAEEEDQDVIRLADGVELSPGSVAVLQSAWRHRSKRSGHRKETSQPLQVAVTIAAVHHNIFVKERPEWIAGRREQEAERLGALEQAGKGGVKALQQGYYAEEIDYQIKHDIWDIPYGQRDVLEERWNEQVDPDAYGFHEAVETDFSSLGCRFRIQANSRLRLRIGDVAGLRRSVRSEIVLGVVRWVEIDQQDRFEVGVEMLAKDVHATILRVVDGTRDSAMLPSLVGTHAKSGATILIVPYLPHILQRRLSLIYPNREVPITFSGWPVELSQSFEAYEFGLRGALNEKAEDAAGPLTMDALNTLQEEQVADPPEEKTVWDLL